MKDIDVYGFDYDYTVAVYKETLDELIYNMGRNVLVTEFKVKIIITITHIICMILTS